MKSGVIKSLVAVLAGSFVFLSVLLLPGSVYAWTAPCTPLQSAMVSGDLKVASDGTVYAIVKALSGWNVTVFKFKPPSCEAEIINRPAGIVGDVLSPNAVRGPAETQTPQLAINSHNDIVISYHSSDFSVNFQRKKANQSSFSAPVLVNADAFSGDVAIDEAGNVHYVWYSPKVYYRKYDANNNLVIDTVVLNEDFDGNDGNDLGDGPSIAADNNGNAHVVWEEVSASPHPILYRRIQANGTVDPVRQISQLDDESKFPFIQVGTKGKVHIAWQGATTGQKYEAYYRRCNNKGLKCRAQINVSKTDGNSLNPDVAVCGKVPFVSWREEFPNGAKWRVSVSSGLGAGENVTSGQYGDFHQIATSDGYVHVLYRQENDRAGYTRQSDVRCSGETPPTVTPAPPTPTKTPGAEKEQVDDTSNKIAYAGTWGNADGSVDCLFDGTLHTASGDTQNRAVMNFTGTRVKYWFVRNNTMGQAKILIDGQVAAIVDLSGTSTSECKSWLSPILPHGAHSIDIRPQKGVNKPITLDVLTIYP